MTVRPKSIQIPEKKWQHRRLFHYLSIYFCAFFLLGMCVNVVSPSFPDHFRLFTVHTHTHISLYRYMYKLCTFGTLDPLAIFFSGSSKKNISLAFFTIWCYVINNAACSICTKCLGYAKFIHKKYTDRQYSRLDERERGKEVENIHRFIFECLRRKANK